jgi:hypothetical protein
MAASAAVSASESTPAIAMSSHDVTDVTIHPLVLLSAADHYHRVARGTRKRVVGVLLGQVLRGNVDATNSFAVPFEEDSRNPVSAAFPFAFDSERPSVSSLRSTLTRFCLYARSLSID